MKCPHCLVEFHASKLPISLGTDEEGQWGVERYECPNAECCKLILYLVVGGSDWSKGIVYNRILIHPKGINRQPIPPEVPSGFREDYIESCLVLSDSPKASAALSRRNLQYILREKAGVKPSTLADEIQEVLDKNLFPSYIAEIVDAVRNVGNFAAHPTKSKQTGEIIDVEIGEAELNLDVIEALFDFYFVNPTLIAKKKAVINKKLQDAGKPPMK
ncbi:DUF4145 domain-containing protein [Chloroflexota bacterium]